MLEPFRTILRHLSKEKLDLAKVILIGGSHRNDQAYCSIVAEELGRVGWSTDIDAKIAIGSDSSTPAKIASYVSKAAEDATNDGVDLWVDLTPGPKQRSAVIFAAASALPRVQIVYSVAASGGYEVQQLSPLGSYNQWLGRHGIQIRNYREELLDLAKKAEDSGTGQAQEVLDAVSALLGSQRGFDLRAREPESSLLKFATWVANVEVPRAFFGIHGQPEKEGLPLSAREWDDRIRSDHDARLRSAGRASQLVYQLRHVFAHYYPVKLHDCIAFLDSLAFLAARLLSLDQPKTDMQIPDIATMFLAVDSDDLGRRFEERLSECVNAQDVVALRQWSRRIEEELSECMVRLEELWGISLIARTGDGFLAAFPAIHFDDLKKKFQPRLQDATVTTGIGHSVKEAYLALKLGKARNRGGGIFFSFDPPKEEILWREPSPGISS